MSGDHLMMVVEYSIAADDDFHYFDSHTILLTTFLNLNYLLL